MARGIRISAGLVCALVVTGLVADETKSPLTMPDFFSTDEPRARVLILGTFHFKDAGLDSYKPKYDIDILSDERQKELGALLDSLMQASPEVELIEVKDVL